MSALFDAARAQADFKLTKPTAWIVEDPQGGPQKAGPCGPETDGDAMLTQAITEVKAGATIEVEFAETAAHTGWFRIALAHDRSELEEVSFSDASCASAAPAAAHGNVLADGIGKTDVAGQTRSFKEQISLPNQPCEKCTLQVIQVLTDAARECVHYHCADVKIVAAESGAGGAAGAPHASGGSSSSPIPMRTSGGTGGDAAKGGSGGAASPAPSTGPLIAAASTQSGSAGAASMADHATIKHAAMGGAGGAAGKPAASSSKDAKPSEKQRTKERGLTSSDAGADSGAEAKDEDTSESVEAEPMREAKAEESGCAVSQPGAHNRLVSAALFALASVLLGARRRRRDRKTFAASRVA